MAQPAVNVTKSRDGYTLHWTAKEMFYKHIGHTFQVQYKTDAASWEVRPSAQEGAYTEVGDGVRKHEGEPQPATCVAPCR